jgi:hypothetical protein
MLQPAKISAKGIAFALPDPTSMDMALLEIKPSGPKLLLALGVQQSLSGLLGIVHQDPPDDSPGCRVQYLQSLPAAIAIKCLATPPSFSAPYPAEAVASPLNRGSIAAAEKGRRALAAMPFSFRLK